MHRDRMERLAEVLRGVVAARKPFNMDHWLTDIEASLRSPMHTGSRDEACGTACCALGYAALDPVLRAQGLGLRVGFFDTPYDPDGTEIGSLVDYNAAAKARGIRWAEPFFGDEVDTYAGAAFFGISFDAAMHLFAPFRYQEDARDEPIEPEAVLARVLEVIALDGEAPDDEDDDEGEH